MDQATLIAEITAARESLTAYLRGLDEDRWDAPSLCEGWAVRDVLAHLAAAATDVLGGKLEGIGTDAYTARQIEERKDKSPAELLDEFTTGASAMEAMFASIPAENWDAPMPRFGSMANAVGRNLYDIWVHTQDIRIPLGDGILDAPGAKYSLDVVAGEMPGRAARLEGVGTVHLRGHDHHAKAEIGNGIEVGVSGPTPVLALVGTGRIPLDRAIAEHGVTVEPDPPAGFADGVNIYGP